MARLTNAKVRQLGLDYKAAKLREAGAKADAQAIRDQLLEQLRIRKVDEATFDNVVVTRKAKNTRVWSLDKLKARLSRALLAKVVVPTVVASELDAAVKAGVITEADREACLVETVESAPYVDVRITSA